MKHQLSHSKCHIHNRCGCLGCHWLTKLWLINLAEQFPVGNPGIYFIYYFSLLFLIWRYIVKGEVFLNANKTTKTTYNTEKYYATQMYSDYFAKLA